MTWLHIVISVSALLLIIACIAIGKALIKRGKIDKKRRNHAGRDSPSNQTRRTPHRSGAVKTPSTRSRTQFAVSDNHIPRITQNDAYLRYRKCPRCHTENTLARQYIFKTGDHSFHCTRCNHRFDF